MGTCQTCKKKELLIRHPLKGKQCQTCYGYPWKTDEDRKTSLAEFKGILAIRNEGFSKDFDPSKSRVLYREKVVDKVRAKRHEEEERNLSRVDKWKKPIKKTRPPIASMTTRDLERELSSLELSPRTDSLSPVTADKEASSFFQKLTNQGDSQHFGCELAGSASDSRAWLTTGEDHTGRSVSRITSSKPHPDDSLTLGRFSKTHIKELIFKNWRSLTASKEFDDWLSKKRPETRAYVLELIDQEKLKEARAHGGSSSGPGHPMAHWNLTPNRSSNCLDFGGRLSQMGDEVERSSKKK